MRVNLRRLALGPVLAAGTAATLAFVLIQPAEAAVTAKVRVTGTLAIRSGPTTVAATVGKLKNNATVAISCSVSGQYVRGKVRNTAQWDRLTSGSYVSHAYVATGVAIGTCPAPAPPPAPTPPVPAPAPPIGPTGSMTQAQFIAAAAILAQASQREFRVPASVTIAQAILESGWGRSGLTTNDRNFFGIKCASQGTIANGCHTYRTSECNPDGTCFPVDASFRTYASALDSFRDHGKLLATASRYLTAFGYTGDPNRFIIEIHRGGYATSPTYAENVTRLMTTYNLYQYDLR
jgi:flagellar protein FlgJ